jgi:hypothetical protein
MGDWPTSIGVTPDYATQAEFARLSAVALEELPFVRYAWYSYTPDQPTWSAYYRDGSRNLVGTVWALAPVRLEIRSQLR